MKLDQMLEKDMHHHWLLQYPRHFRVSQKVGIVKTVSLDSGFEFNNLQ